jgi:predicted lysophospholipase L1 biosynthesis ABC-type transport system permease subunit
VRQGRSIAETDRGRNVVMLSERAARSLWPGENPIGKRVFPGGNDSLSEVVGIIPDVQTTSLEKEGSLTAYVPYWQHPQPAATLLVSSTGAPESVVAAARAAIHAVGSAVPVSRVRTMQQIVSGAVAQRRFQLLLLLLFAGSALATASIGIYGIISHSLVRRSNEIGVRMALGAQPGDVHRLVLTEVLRPAAAGLVAGIGLSLALGQTFRALLFEVQPADPLTLVTVAAVIMTVAAAACYVPAKRASRRGPTLALRAD